MRVLMLVATSVATDTRVLREASSLAGIGHSVHIVGKSVPAGFAPGPGVTVSSVGSSSVFRREARDDSPTRLSWPARFARWLLLPQHRNSSFSRWADGAYRDAAQRPFDVVHAHDFTALGVGARLAEERGVPLVYDSHELWSGVPREYRPTPLQDRRERRQEAEWGGRAAAVITVGPGVAEELTRQYGWTDIAVVRNTFPLRPDSELPDLPARPRGAVYAGRVGAYRELEVVAAASRDTDLPITIVGPGDETWLATFDSGRATVRPALPLDDVSREIAAAGLALVTHSDKWPNHRLAMPNKLFHAVSLGVPVVATDVGQLGALVREHRLGVLYRPGDAASLTAALRTAVDGYPALVDQVRRARPRLSWPEDEAVLRSVYATLMTDHRTA
ncbi:glycosyl transferase family 1 [Tessaracoccus lapidicaptus]|uniref:Glycosyl transferase family 1 n=1 Tax=Tessaracoccus lapidicaptus TaxID=1427523 RepID=A0A1C0AMM4_9ACTN|nr:MULTISPECIES: glycosyltransferase [Tessaracoccus]AQX15592.1 glycosyl transferase family 1 [Tessaracoccus sp. T2.5-30]OCL33961.1 glycosyl transferase family 1 [Tessaracoccus lapidicaptus]VEP39944.1 Glycogen synthase [Tessaracoccus lapidicaptus]